MVVMGIILLIIASIPLPLYLTRLLSVYFNMKTDFQFDIWVMGIMTIEAMCAGGSYYCLLFSLF